MPAALNNLAGVHTPATMKGVESSSRGLKNKENLFSTSQLWGRAIKDESLIAQFIQTASTAMEEDAPIDATFVNDTATKEAMFEEYKDEIHPDFKDEVMDSRNKSEMMDKIEWYKTETEKEKAIEDMGIPGTLMRIGGAFFDLPLYMGSVATAEITAPALAISAGATAFRRFIIGGASEEAIIALQDQIGEREKTKLDYVLAPLFGGGANAIFRYNPMFKKTSQDAIESTLKVKELEKSLEGVTDELEKETIKKAHIKTLDLDPNKELTIRESLKKMDDKTKMGYADSVAYNLLRTDLAFFVKGSKSETLSKIGKDAFIDGTLQTNQANLRTAAEQGQEVEKLLNVSFQHSFNKPIREFVKDKYTGKGIVKGIKDIFKVRYGSAYNTISSIAGKVQSRRNLSKISDDEAVAYAEELFIKEGLQPEQAVKHAKSIVSALSEDAKRTGEILTDYKKKGFDADNIRPSEIYMPIQYNKNMAAEFANRGLGFGEFKRFIGGSLESGIKKIAAANNVEPNFESLEFLTDAISQSVWHNKDSIVNKHSYNDILDTLKAGKDGVVYTKERSPFDYSYIKEFDTPKGKQTVSFEDLVNTNYAGVRNSYAKKMGGGLTAENIKVKHTNVEFDYAKAKEIKDNLVKIVEEQGQALRDVARIADAPDVGTVLRIASRYSKNVIDMEDLIKLKGKARTDRINLIVKNTEEAIAKELNNVDAKIKNAIPEEQAGMKDEILKQISSLEEAMRLIVKQVHKANTKEALGADYDRVLKEEMDKAFSLASDQLSPMKKSIDDLFTKKTEVELDLGSDESAKIIREKIEKELMDAGASAKTVKADLVMFDEMVNEWRGNPTSTDPSGTLTQIQRIMKNLNISRLLGGTGWTLAAEASNVAYRTGVRDYMELSSMKALVKQMKTGEMDDRFAEEIQIYFGLGDGLMQSVRANVYSHETDTATSAFSGSGFEKFLNKLEGVSEKLGDATLLIGGIKPLTSLFEITAAKDAITNMTMALKNKAKLTANDLKDLDEMGINEAMLGRISAQFEEFGEYTSKSWSKGHKVTSLNFNKWEDKEAKRMLVTATRRITNTIVQVSYLGDKTGVVYGDKLFRNNLVGGATLELKDYIITAYVKQLGRGLARADAYTLGMMMAQVAALSTATAMQNFVNFSGNPEKLEKSFEPTNFFRTVAGRTTVSSIVPIVADPVFNAFTGSSLSSSRYHNPVQGYWGSLPSVDLAARAWNSMSIVPRSVASGELRNKDIKSFTGMLPLSNTVLVKPALEAVMSE